jgi:hypothetical protein
VKFKDEPRNLRVNEAGVLQGTVLGPVLYLIYTSALPTSDNATTATFTDDIAVLATHAYPEITSIKLQAAINKINDSARKWRIKINQSKFTHITFTLRNHACPTVQMGNVPLPPSKKNRSEMPRHSS